MGKVTLMPRVKILENKLHLTTFLKSTSTTPTS